MAWPLAARPQHQALPVVGWISPDAPDLLQAFREGLKETGYIERDSMAIEYRAAQNQIDRLPEFAADLVRRKVDVIVAGNTAAALAVKAATTTIPVVFNTPYVATEQHRPEIWACAASWTGCELRAFANGNRVTWWRPAVIGDQMNNRLISIVCGTALILATSGAVLAADMAVKALSPAPPAVWDWTGFYIGVGGSFNWTHFDQSLQYPAP